ncbi:MAG: MBL fold metallo-hydrolase [Erysipelotrichaceae bacterium]|nr:MBL fold metallo-hydrolase [Erysipelotrichaceae bacterium]
MKIVFTREKITEHIWRIFGLGDTCMYYVEGKQRGLLIDTAYGIGDLRTYIEKTFLQPYEVLLTHGHWDHANGAGQWDRVYLHRKDRELYRSFTDISFRRDRLRKTVKDIDTCPEELFVKDFEGDFSDLEEGMRFRLGDVTAEVIETPGHTQGIVSLLVEEDRTLLLGDACGEFTFMFREEASAIATYQRTLKKILDQKDRYDRILRQHGSYGSPLSLIKENMELCHEILEKRDDHIPWNYMGQPVYVAKKIDPDTHRRADGKSGNIVYSMNKLHKETI